MERNGRVVSKAAAAVGLVLAAVLLLNAGSRSRDDAISDSGCNLCEEFMVGSFSCALQSGEVLAQLNFKGSGDLTPSETGAGMVVLGAAPGGSASQCESLGESVVNKLHDADCETGRLMSPTADQRVFDFVCRGRRATLVRSMGDASKEVISLAP